MTEEPILYDTIIGAVRADILDDVDQVDAAHTDAELTAWARQAAHEILHVKRHLCISAEGQPIATGEIITDQGVKIPEKYLGALVHGTAMYAFSEDQQRSSFERGLFNAQLGIRG